MGGEPNRHCTNCCKKKRRECTNSIPITWSPRKGNIEYLNVILLFIFIFIYYYYIPKINFILSTFLFIYLLSGAHYNFIFLSSQASSKRRWSSETQQRLQPAISSQLLRQAALSYILMPFSLLVETTTAARRWFKKLVIQKIQKMVHFLRKITDGWLMWLMKSENSSQLYV